MPDGVYSTPGLVVWWVSLAKLLEDTKGRLRYPKLPTSPPPKKNTQAHKENIYKLQDNQTSLPKCDNKKPNRQTRIAEGVPQGTRTPKKQNLQGINSHQIENPIEKLTQAWEMNLSAF